jgi:hypothetical protein
VRSPIVDGPVDSGAHPQFPRGIHRESPPQCHRRNRTSSLREGGVYPFRSPPHLGGRVVSAPGRYQRARLLGTHTTHTTDTGRGSGRRSGTPPSIPHWAFRPSGCQSPWAFRKRRTSPVDSRGRGLALPVRQRQTVTSDTPSALATSTGRSEGFGNLGMPA